MLLEDLAVGDGIIDLPEGIGFNSGGNGALPPA